jgi:hypothetical protein
MRRSLRTIDSEKALANYLTGIGILKMRSEGVELEEAAKKNGVSLAYAWSLSTIAQHFPKEVLMRLGIGKCETIYKLKVPGNHLPVIYRIAGMCSMYELRQTLTALYGEPNGRERVAVLQCNCKARRPIPYARLSIMKCDTCIKYKERAENCKLIGLCRCGRARHGESNRCISCIESMRKHDLKRRITREVLDGVQVDHHQNRIESRKQRRREREAKYVANGLCRCGKTPSPGFRCCERCKMKFRAWSKAYYVKRPRAHSSSVEQASQ